MPICVNDKPLSEEASRDIPAPLKPEEFDFGLLFEMQKDHFWYRGRHRFILEAFRRWCYADNGDSLRVIDAGCGCGGWMDYLLKHFARRPAECAVGDSSPEALEYASQVLPPEVERYPIDLMSLGWENRWDVIFLLDVIEHIPDHELAMREVASALSPGGFAVVTVPAFQQLWSFNDEIAGHQRRYTIADFAQLSEAVGLKLCDARYFMFFLSPLLAFSRWLAERNVSKMSQDERQELAEKMHRVPSPLINTTLKAIFGLETPLGHRISFPFGSSLLAVLRHPTS